MRLGGGGRGGGLAALLGGAAAPTILRPIRSRASPADSAGWALGGRALELPEGSGVPASPRDPI